MANPPTERAEAEAVARAQYNYCVDIVDQGVETLAALAEEQVHSHRWYFWWGLKCRGDLPHQHEAKGRARKNPDSALQRSDLALPQLRPSSSIAQT